MYQTLHNLVLAFHGCSRETYEKVLYDHKDLHRTAYDSVRGIFFEGGPIYPGSGILDKSHIQICVRNPNCIKGYFAPKEFHNSYTRI